MKIKRTSIFSSTQMIFFVLGIGCGRDVVTYGRNVLTHEKMLDFQNCDPHIEL
jgi:hypothetical protein